MSEDSINLIENQLNLQWKSEEAVNVQPKQLQHVFCLNLNTRIQIKYLHSTCAFNFKCLTNTVKSVTGDTPFMYIAS